MFDYAIGCFSGRGQATGTAPGGAPRPVSRLNDMNIIKREKNKMYIMLNFMILLQIPPRAGVISVPPQARPPPPPAHPGAPRPIEVHPGAPRPSLDNHPGAPRPTPEPQSKPSELPLGSLNTSNYILILLLFSRTGIDTEKRMPSLLFVSLWIKR